MTTATPTAAPRRSRLQFSLRLLLLALTAFAIGFPVWYRWPFEETEYLYPGGDETKPPIGKSVKTWRRSWGGGKVLSGRAMIQVDRPLRGVYRTKTIEHFEDGQHHGPIEHYWEGRLVRTGQYSRGQREGKWIDYDYATGTPTCTATWHQDRLDGPYILAYASPRLDPFATSSGAQELAADGRQTFLFSKGRLIDAEGRPVPSRLLEQLEAGAIDNPDIANALRQLMPVTMEFVETPLTDATLYLQDVHNIPIVMDMRRVDEDSTGRLPARMRGIERPITLYVKGVDLCSGLTLLAAPEDLAFEYRYGVLYLTTAEHAQDDRDPTGVADIRPVKGSPLAQAWNELCKIDLSDVPLDEALQSLGKPLAIGFDLTALETRGIRAPRVSKSLKNLPFKHVLALLLDELGLRCEARGGDTIVILLRPDS